MPETKPDEFEAMNRAQMVAEIKRLRRDVEGYTRTLDAREARIRELSDLQARLERQVKDRDAKIAEQARRPEQMPRLDDRICAARSALKDSLSLLNEAHILVKK